MPRVCLRLVAALTLVAYFLLNTQLSLAVVSLLAPAKATPASPSEKPKRCCGCTRAKQAEQHSSHSSDEQCPSRSGCPCCPGAPCDGKHCPLPSICPSCGVSGAICGTISLDWTPASNLIETVPPLDVLSPSSPFLDGQVRPPKA